MLKSTYLMFMPIIVLGACSSSQPLTKFDANGDYIGWHCSGKNKSSSTWHCVQNTDQDHQLVASEEIPTGSTDLKTERSPIDPSITANDSNQSSTEEIEKQQNTTINPYGGFQVQLGAYSSHNLAIRAAHKLSLTQDLRITQLWSKQKPVFVILYGHFSSRDKAEQEVLLLTQTNPHLTYWIRPTASIEKAKIQ